MLFNTLKFFLVFPLIFVFYWAIPSKYNQWRKLFLILVSYLIYMNWKPVFALILLWVTIVTFAGGWCLAFFSDKCKNKQIIWLFSILGFLPLLVFKYYNFINASIAIGLEHVGVRFYMPGLNWAIPVGISFFTFQAMGYMLDVYHGRTKIEKNFIDYVLFVSFFPQIASGPISKADELLPQIKQENKFNYDIAVSGLRYLLWGMFLKVVLADRAGIYVDSVFAEYEKFSGMGCFLASVLYSIQIYADFAGYSLMAIGLARTLGFNLINNFNRPYFATSVTDFWKRWHISLTRWLTQQIYIPLGGNRCSKVRNYWNIMVTFLVSGLWHGANWTFVVWGGLHGVCQIIEKTLGWRKKDYKGLSRLLRSVLTFLIVTLAWVFFRSPSLTDALAFFTRFASTSGELIAQGSTLVYIFLGLIPVLSYEILCEFFPKKYRALFDTPYVRWASYLAIFTLLLLIGVFDGSSFIYVSF